MFRNPRAKDIIHRWKTPLTRLRRTNGSHVDLRLVWDSVLLWEDSPGFTNDPDNQHGDWKACRKFSRNCQPPVV